ncbi:25212_t:CDS:1, partial [Gigaspora margarita]
GYEGKSHNRATNKKDIPRFYKKEKELLYSKITIQPISEDKRKTDWI